MERPADPAAPGDPTSGAATPNSGTDTSPRRLLAVLLTLFGLFTITGILATGYWEERRNRAVENFRMGEARKARKEYKEAIEHYRTALAFAPNNITYKLALAVALFEYGRPEEAELRLREVLDRDPTNGFANLIMARILARAGKQQPAVLSYHRAIYGFWPDSPQSHRMAARWELIGLLRAAGANKQLLAELLALLEEAPDEPSEKKRIAAYFLQAGSPRDAAGIYREVTQKNRRDGEAWAALGEAEFLQGNFLQAQSAFREAIRTNPRDMESQKQFVITTEILQLDPSLRRLSFSERYRRSFRLVEMTLRAFDACFLHKHQTAGGPAGASGSGARARPAGGLPEAILAVDDPLRADIVEARKLVQAGRKRRPEMESVELQINLAERIWNARAALCGGPAAGEEALSHVMAKLTR